MEGCGQYVQGGGLERRRGSPHGLDPPVLAWPEEGKQPPPP